MKAKDIVDAVAQPKFTVLLGILLMVVSPFMDMPKSADAVFVGLAIVAISGLWAWVKYNP